MDHARLPPYISTLPADLAADRYRYHHPRLSYYLLFFFILFDEPSSFDFRSHDQPWAQARTEVRLSDASFVYPAVEPEDGIHALRTYYSGGRAGWEDVLPGDRV